jgi:hypothetical protein
VIRFKLTRNVIQIPLVAAAMDQNRARCKAHLRQGYVRVLRPYPDDLVDSMMGGEGEVVSAGYGSFLSSLPTSSASRHTPPIAAPAGVEILDAAAGGKVTVLSDAQQRDLLSRKLAARLQSSCD